MDVLAWVLTGVAAFCIAALARRGHHNKRKIEELNAQMAEMQRAESIITRAEARRRVERRKTPKRDRHLKLLGLVPFAMWLLDALGRRPLATATVAMAAAVTVGVLTTTRPSTRPAWPTAPPNATEADPPEVAGPAVPVPVTTTTIPSDAATVAAVPIAARAAPSAPPATGLDVGPPSTTTTTAPSVPPTTTPPTTSPPTTTPPIDDLDEDDGRRCVLGLRVFDLVVCIG